MNHRITLSFLCLSVAPVFADNDLSALKIEIDSLAKLTKASPPSDKDDALSAVSGSIWKLLPANATSKAMLQDILSHRRTDVQTAAASGSSGSTSATSPVLLPALFGFAFEHNSLTRTVTGTTTTFSLNPVNLVCGARMDANGNSLASSIARRDDETCKTFANRFAITASFDTSRSGQPAALEALKLKTLSNQFSELGVRVELINRRKLTAAAYEKAHAESLTKWFSEATALQRSLDAFIQDRDTRTLIAEVGKRLGDELDGAAWQTLTVDKRTTIIEGILKDIRLPERLQAAIMPRWLATLRADRVHQDAVANAAVLTFDYTFQQPDLAKEAIGTIVPKDVRPPNLHTARLNFAKGIPGYRLDLRTTTSSSWFQETRPGMPGKFRDFRFSGEAQFKMREIQNYGTPTLSFAGLYAYLHQQPLGLGLVAFNDAAIKEKGHIRLLQIKLTLPTSNAAITFPISFTYSNRTELIKESEVRGQIGFAFNLDALFKTAATAK